MGFFDFLKPSFRQWTGEPVERALRPWLSDAQEGRQQISAQGGFKHAWVQLTIKGDRVTVTHEGEPVGFLSADMPECAEVVAEIARQGVQVATVKCFADEERGRDGYRAILTLGPHKYQPKPPFRVVPPTGH